MSTKPFGKRDYWRELSLSYITRDTGNSASYWLTLCLWQVKRSSFSLKNSSDWGRGGKIKVNWNDAMTSPVLHPGLSGWHCQKPYCIQTFCYYRSAINANIAIPNTLCSILICPAGCKLLTSSHSEAVKNKTIAFATWEKEGKCIQALLPSEALSGNVPM